VLGAGGGCCSAPIIAAVFEFPRPGGPYSIGTVTYHWVDDDRRELCSDDPDARRELMVQIWYPAVAAPSSPPAAYMPEADAVAPALARFLHAPDDALDYLKDVTTNAVVAAPVADGEPAYPLPLTTMRAVYESLPGNGYYVQVAGMFHLDMTDAPFLPLAVEAGLTGPIGGDRAHRIVNAYSVAFFDGHLRVRPSTLLDGPAPQFPEVRFEARRP
jgi:hypothetical protein